MSLLSTERIRVYLHPQQLVMARLSGWLKPKLGAKALLNDWATTDEYANSLNALAQQLKSTEWQEARTTVILSGHALHYRIAPWHADLTEEEQHALLRHRYAEVFGATANSWKLSTCDGGFGKNGLAVAIGNELLEQVKSVFSTSAVHLEGIEPSFMSVFNYYRQQLGAEPAWFILLESGFLSAGLINQQGWAGVRSLPVSTDLMAGLELQLRNWAMQFGVEGSELPIYLACMDGPSDTVIFSKSRKVIKLEQLEQSQFAELGQTWASVLCV